MSEPNKPTGSVNSAAPPRPSQSAHASLEHGAMMPPKPVSPLNRKGDSAAPVPLASRTSTQTMDSPLIAPPAPAAPPNSAPQTQRTDIPRESVKIHTFEDLLADLDLLTPETSADAPADIPAVPPATESASPAEPAEELTEAKPRTRSARAHRIPLALAVTVRGRVESHNAIREETRTSFLLPHGAVLSLAARISSGETIFLINQANGREAQCNVLDVQAGEAGKNQVEVEFRQPEVDFWPISFPGDDAQELGRKTENAQSSPAIQPSLPPGPMPIASERVTLISARGSEMPAEVLPQSEAPAPAPVMVSPLPPAVSAPPKQARSQVIDLTTLILADDPSKPDVKPIVKVAGKRAMNSEIQTTRGGGSGKSLTISASTTGSAGEKQHPATHSASSVPQNSNVIFSTNENRSSSSKKWVLLAVAASLLLAVAVGGTIYLRHDSSNVVYTPASQAPQNSNEKLPSSNAFQPAAVPSSTGAVNPIPATGNASGDAKSEGRTPLGADAGAKTPAKGGIWIEPSAVSPPTRTKAPAKPKFSPGALSVSLVPKSKAAARNDEPLAAPSINSIPGGIVSGTPAGSSITSMASSAQPIAPISVGGRVQSPRRLSAVEPVYPVLARRSGIEGNVVIQADIDVTGKIAGMKVVSGPAPLQQAALDALRQWKYTPGLLNGQPIASRITVTVQFRLKWLPSRHLRQGCGAHSFRKVCIGSTRVARRAGT